MKGKLLVLNAINNNSRRRTQTTNGKPAQKFEIKDPHRLQRRPIALGKKGSQ